MSPQAYKVVINHTNEISGSKNLYTILNAHTPNIVRMNGDFSLT